MEKIKLYAVLVLTAAVLICTAMLPRWAAGIQDRQTISRSGQRRMDSVSLDIQEHIPIMGKLSLVRYHNNASPVTEWDARMSGEEAKKAFDTALLPYIQAGLIPSFPWEEYICIPYLFQEPGVPEHYAIFWHCYHESKLPASDYIHLYLDDETGTVMTVEYFKSSHDAYGSGEITAMLDILCRTYFDSLGIADYVGSQADLLSRSYGEYEGFNWSTQIRAFVLDDAQYGSTRIEFVLSEGGFYTMFPDV